MSVIALIRECKAAGIRLQARGDRLHVEAPAGSLTPELRQALNDHKAGVLALHAIRARLRTIASSLGIPRTLVDELPIEELDTAAEQAALCDGKQDDEGNPLTHSLLVFYLRELARKVQ
ncbi:hypothetical protein HDE78_000237 [Rhodanobacter sp. K2T2]|uniref:TubC N-terminal docking domain-related protein n=1 Tax=Rhodanobacter sp. K2T2 TaxID=2723085 RepID=UPI0015CEB47B|nr:hypothetical protein [Rhodanobacter sp. K2T2]NYE27312.1 hypothetical protein [Rhodanobacter sp. K2T2]